MRNTCELCQNPLPIIEKLYDESDRWIVLDCDSCKVPMIVWKHHTMQLNQVIGEEMEKALTRAADEHFGDVEYFIDRYQRSISDHLHWHARPVDSIKK